MKTLKQHKKVTKKQASSTELGRGGRKITLKRRAEVPTLSGRSKVVEIDEPTLEQLSKTETSVPREVAPVEQPVERQPYDGNTAFNLYLREVGQTKLLTPQEEVDLAKRIKKGDKKAREQMIKANLRLVVKIAREYEDYGMPLLDLINEGNMGLMKAVERFDPAKGAKLSTYSAWWIKQSIKRALANQSKTIRLPVHVVDKLFHMRQASVKLQEVLGREPTDEELGDELGFSAQKVAQLRTAAIRPASLEAPLGDDETSRIADVVRDETADTPYEQLEEKTNTSMLRELVATLDPREAEILRYRFGLDGDPERTLEEVGQKFGVTRERIRQIQNVALNKLRKQIEKLETVKAAA
ncbi:sigma-70 family RNA polymerase sigma factor [Pedosphaera parvula]|uniref:RNA polymerase, sigma 70 subunit, RpoD subfamily n=1 Tax=Pedosphaera parvula (strain Ellin514) TaxID=320771 RepID=B9XJZ6_PEDPL|nr:RNA polymerase, sigma 70 subunit, RpoD subfamily [Pedosphaera parvula Ellin514]